MSSKIVQLLTSLVPSKCNKIQNINDLIDDCLLLIFARLPVHSQIKLHRICKRWAALQPATLRTKRSLELSLVTEDETFNIPNKKDSILNIFDYPEMSCELITNAFPNLTSLSIYQAVLNSPKMFIVFHLLNKLSRNCVNLKLSIHHGWQYVWKSMEEICPRIHLLFNTLNTMSSLKQLNLNLNDIFKRQLNPSEFNLSILSQLAEFTFESSSSQNTNAWILKQIAQFGSSNKELRIKLKNVIHIHDGSLDKLPLNQLTNLCLEVDFKLLKETNLILPVFPSIKSLSLEYLKTSHHEDLKLLNLSCTMPALEHIHLRMLTYNCDQCNKFKYPSVRRKCLDQFMSQLKLCKNLKKKFVWKQNQWEEYKDKSHMCNIV